MTIAVFPTPLDHLDVVLTVSDDGTHILSEFNLLTDEEHHEVMEESEDLMKLVDSYPGAYVLEDV